MKKLLTILGAVGLTASTGATVIACGNPDEKPVSKMSLEEANEHFGKIYDDWRKASDQVRDPNVPEEKKPEFRSQEEELAFKMLDFLAQVFLETNFSVTFENEKPTIKEKENDDDYKENLAKLMGTILNLITPDFEENHKDWADILKDHHTKLEEKLKNLGDD